MGGLVRFVDHDAPKVKDPVFLEGLPGVGNVGKLACDHLADALEATLWKDIFSRDFPPQVMVQDDGTVRLVRAQLWVAPKVAGGRDLVIMTGDFQPMTPEGQFDLVEGVLDILQDVGCQEMYTLGGYGLGSSVDEPRVLGAATHPEVVDRLSEQGIHFEEDEPGGGIIGASGLFLGLGKERGMQGACLMGETSGYMVDPKAARSLIRALGVILDLGSVDVEDLDDKAQEIDRIAQQLQEAESARGEPGDLHYIG